jgi:hypothetical protein
LATLMVESCRSAGFFAQARTGSCIMQVLSSSRQPREAGPSSMPAACSPGWTGSFQAPVCSRAVSPTHPIQVTGLN